MRTIKIFKKLHHGRDRLMLQFPYDEELIKVIRTFEGRKWSSTMRCWHIDDSRDNREKVIIKLKPIANLNWQIDDEPKKLIKIPQAYYDKLEIKRYSENTKRT